MRSLVLDLNEDWADINIGPYVYCDLRLRDGAGRGRRRPPGRGLAARCRGRPRLRPPLWATSLPQLLAEVRRRQIGLRADRRQRLILPRPREASGRRPPVRSCRSRASSCRCHRAAAMLVFAKWLDDAFLRQAAHRLRLEPARLRLGDAPIADGLAAARLEGPDGGDVGQIVWQPWHPGRTQLGWLIPALLGSLVVFTLFTQIVLRSIRRATAVVRQSEARFRDIAEAASDWIWETDRSLDADLRLRSVRRRHRAETRRRAGPAAGSRPRAVRRETARAIRRQASRARAAISQHRMPAAACAAARTPAP